MGVNFTDISATAALIAATFNNPLDELDQEIEDVKDGTAALSAPVITSFVNSTHDHADAAGGGQLDWGDIWSDAAHDHSSAAEGGATLGAHTVGGNLTLGNTTYVVISNLFQPVSSAAPLLIMHTAANQLRINTALVGAGVAGVTNLGDATYYWNDVSYKTLTDRGCLGWFENGVEMPNGSKVSDLEALKLIKPHPTQQTVYGVPRLDYATMPMAVYKPAPIDPETDEKTGEDGAELTALVSIILGAIKELDKRIATLEIA